METLACQRKRNAESKAWQIQLIIENGFSIYFHRMYITEISDIDIVASKSGARKSGRQAHGESHAGPGTGG